MNMAAPVLFWMVVNPDYGGPVSAADTSVETIGLTRGDNWLLVGRGAATRNRLIGRGDLRKILEPQMNADKPLPPQSWFGETRLSATGDTGSGGRDTPNHDHRSVAMHLSSHRLNGRGPSRTVSVAL
jgi:hypothetical protein